MQRFVMLMLKNMKSKAKSQDMAKNRIIQDRSKIHESDSARTDIYEGQFHNKKFAFALKESLQGNFSYALLEPFRIGEGIVIKRIVLPRQSVRERSWLINQEESQAFISAPLPQAVIDSLW
jgi:hypothetical protein